MLLLTHCEGLASQLCNLLGEPAPELPPIGADDLEEEERAAADAISAPAGAGRLPGLDEATGGGRFEDEDARQFYEMLPDLRPMLPEVLVDEAKERMERSKQKAAVEASDGDTSAAQPEPSEESTTPSPDAPEAEASAEELLERELEAEEAAAAAAASDAGDGLEEPPAAAASSAADADDAADESAAAAASTVDAEEATGTSAAATESSAPSRQAQLDQFLGSLPTLVNRDLIDKAAVQFATSLNSKASRRRLAQAMLTVHRSRCDLLPFYARMAAVLGPVAPELGCELADRLQREFKHVFHKRDHTNLESKLKVVRFIGELVKFGLLAPTDAASDVKLLVINFSNHSVEMACALLESCGRYLYATPETHLRLKVYLRNLWNKKTKIVTDERLSAMIENAYYSVVPPDTSRLAKAVQLPPMMQFLQKLLFKDLCNATVEKVLNLCLRLPWDDPTVEQFVIDSFSSVWCVPYGSVHCLASVLAGLAPFHQAAAIAVVDNVLEDIRLGMEINAHRLNQRRVACLRYLGELYNYCLVESGLVFNTLYSLITLGAAAAVGCGDPTAAAPEAAAAAAAAASADAGPTAMDPPEHLLRIRLACVLLETCGQYFDSGSNKKRLDAFLLYLQQYYWYKRQHPAWSTQDRPFPLDMEYLYFETVDSLRPKFKHVASVQEARALVEKQEKAFLAKLERVAAKLQQQGKAAAASSGLQQQQLQPIAEGSAGATDEDNDDDDVDEGGGTEGDEDTEGGNGLGGKRRGGRPGTSQSEGDGEEGGTSTDAAEASPTLSRRSSPRPELLACPEDDDFVRAFERLQQPASAAGIGGEAAAAGVELPPPQSQQAAVAGDSATIGFTVMTRRGGGSGGGSNRHQPVVQLPADSHLAQRYLAAVEADAREREAVKRATLSITETQMMMEATEDGNAVAAALQQQPLPDWRSGQQLRSRGGGQSGGWRGKPAGARHF